MLFQKVRPSIRLLCLGVGVLLLTMAVASWRAGEGVGNLSGFGVFAAVFLVLGTVGILEDDGEPPGNDRFHELADPARTLLAEDFQGAPREPAPTSRRR
jgi:hypothetical protein